MSEQARAGGGQEPQAYETVRFPRAAETVQYPRTTPTRPAQARPAQARPVQQAPPAPEQVPPGRRRRNSVKLWLVVGMVAQIGLLAAIVLRPGQDAAPAASVQAGPTTSPAEAARTERPREQRTEADAEPRASRTPARQKAGSGLAFTAVAGPGCPRDGRRTVNIIGVPGRNGWKDAEAPGWKGAGCGNGFLFSDLPYDTGTGTPASNVFQWRFTTGLLGPRQCRVEVYVPRSVRSGQRVWYTVRDGFDDGARTIGEFTLDQRMRRGTWAEAPVWVAVTGGLVMVEIEDTGAGNTTGDQSMAAGPVRLSCR